MGSSVIRDGTARAKLCMYERKGIAGGWRVSQLTLPPPFRAAPLPPSPPTTSRLKFKV